MRMSGFFYNFGIMVPVQIIERPTAASMFALALATLCDLDFCPKESLINSIKGNFKLNRLYLKFATNGYNYTRTKSGKLLSYTSSFDLIWEVRGDCCGDDTFEEFFQCAYDLLSCLLKCDPDVPELMIQQGFTDVSFKNATREKRGKCIRHTVRVLLTWCPICRDTTNKEKLKDLDLHKLNCC